MITLREKLYPIGGLLEMSTAFLLVTIFYKFNDNSIICWSILVALSGTFAYKLLVTFYDYLNFWLEEICSINFSRIFKRDKIVDETLKPLSLVSEDTLFINPIHEGTNEQIIESIDENIKPVDKSIRVHLWKADKVETFQNIISFYFKSELFTFNGNENLRSRKHKTAFYDFIIANFVHYESIDLINRDVLKKDFNAPLDNTQLNETIKVIEKYLKDKKRFKLPIDLVTSVKNIEQHLITLEGIGLKANFKEPGTLRSILIVGILGFIEKNDLKTILDQKNTNGEEFLFTHESIEFIKNSNVFK